MLCTKYTWCFIAHCMYDATNKNVLMYGNVYWRSLTMVYTMGLGHIHLKRNTLIIIGSKKKIEMKCIICQYGISVADKFMVTVK